MKRRRRLLLLQHRNAAKVARPAHQSPVSMEARPGMGSNWIVWSVAAVLVTGIAVVWTWMPDSERQGVGQIEEVQSVVASQEEPAVVPVVLGQSGAEEASGIRLPRPVVVHEIDALVLAEIDVYGDDDVLLEQVAQLAGVASALGEGDQMRRARALATVLQLRRERVVFSRALWQGLSPSLRASVLRVLVESSSDQGMPPVVVVERSGVSP